MTSEQNQNQGHPSSLYKAVTVEAGERAGFYGASDLFAPFLVLQFGISQGLSAFFMAVLMAAMYMATIPGGWVADKFLGRKPAILLGASFMAMSYFAVYNFTLLGAVLLIIGNGLFKPNMTSLIGTFYKKGDMRATAGYSIFYFAINVGGFIGPMWTGIYQAANRWHAVFIASGCFMAVGVALFSFFYRSIRSVSEVDSGNDVSPDQWAINKKTLVRIYLCAPFFWAAFHMGPTILNYWAQDWTDRTLGGILAVEVPFNWYKNLNGFFILFMIPIMGPIMANLRRQGKEPSIPVQLTTGMTLTAASYVILAVAASIVVQKHTGSSLWLVAFWFVITLGELFFSPVGNSMVSQLTPRDKVGTWMGLWMCSIAAGNLMSGAYGYLWDHYPKMVTFVVAAAITGISAIVLLLSIPSLMKSFQEPIKNTPHDSLGVPPNIGSTIRLADNHE